MKVTAPATSAPGTTYKAQLAERLTTRLQRAEAIEAAPEFAAVREHADRRRAAAAKGAETRAVFKALAGSKPVAVRFSDGSVRTL